MSAQAVIYFLLWAGLFALMLRFGCGGHIMGNRHGHDPRGDGSDAGDPIRRESRLVVDPVCGKTIGTRDSKSAFYEGKPYYFCSAVCREKFEAGPEKYAGAISGSARGEHHHGCC